MKNLCALLKYSNQQNQDKHQKIDEFLYLNIMFKLNINILLFKLK